MNHDHYSDDYLAGILLSVKNVAILGASIRDNRPSHWISGFLLGKGYHVFPINLEHAGESILGQPIHARLADLPHPVDMIDVFRRSEALPSIVDEILALSWKPAAIWCQLGIRDDAAAAKAEAAGIKVVMNRALVTEYPLVYEWQHLHGHDHHSAPHAA